MKIVVNLLCQVPTDTTHLGKIANARIPYTLQPAELPQQFAASLRAETRNFLEP
jgi:hypothetical protein